MTIMTMRVTLTGLLAAATLATPALAQDRWDWGGGRHGEAHVVLVGPGVRVLVPELRMNDRGRAFVARNFDADRDGRIDRREADAANRAFLAIAGDRRDRFDWDARDAQGPARGGGWDRRAMHDYGMRQTRDGAMLVLQDVLFKTGSAELRPQALDRLRPLAGYLRANPGVRVRIDGYTDGVGGAAANQDLSERRAASVRMALDDMGVEQVRFRVVGHGEAMPVASNATADGRARNRRVEVTLLGQRADSFRD